MLETTYEIVRKGCTMRAQLGIRGLHIRLFKSLDSALTYYYLVRTQKEAWEIQRSLEQMFKAGDHSTELIITGVECLGRKDLRIHIGNSIKKGWFTLRISNVHNTRVQYPFEMEFRVQELFNIIDEAHHLFSW